MEQTPNTPSVPANPTPPPPSVPQPSSNPVIEATPPRKFSFGSPKFLLVLLVILLLLIGGFIVLSSVIKKQEPAPTQQVNANPLLATVGDKKIYKSDVVSAARQQYTNVTDKVLQQTLNLTIERDILDIVSKQSNVIVSPQEINNSLAQRLGNATNNQIPQNVVTATKYDLLKQKIMSIQVNSITASTASYWTPDSSNPEVSGERKQLALKQQAEGAKALPQIEKLVKNGQTMENATQTIIKQPQYTDLAKIIAVNGYLLNDPSNQSLLLIPKVLTQQDKSILGDTIFTTIFSMQKGDIKTLFTAENSSGYVIQVLDKATGEFKNYNDWLETQKKKYVTIVNPL